MNAPGVDLADMDPESLGNHQDTSRYFEVSENGTKFTVDALISEASLGHSVELHTSNIVPFTDPNTKIPGFKGKTSWSVGVNAVYDDQKLSKVLFIDDVVADFMSRLGVSSNKKKFGSTETPTDPIKFGLSRKIWNQLAKLAEQLNIRIDATSYEDYAGRVWVTAGVTPDKMHIVSTKTGQPLEADKAAQFTFERLKQMKCNPNCFIEARIKFKCTTPDTAPVETALAQPWKVNLEVLRFYCTTMTELKSDSKVVGVKGGYKGTYDIDPNRGYAKAVVSATAAKP